MTTTFKIWTHPATGDVRIYINGLGYQRAAKVWIEEQAADAFGCTLNIRVQSANHSRGEAGNLANEAEEAMTAAAGRRLKSFADALALAN